MLEEILGFIYPRRCPACGKIAVPRGSMICDTCKTAFHIVKEPRCKKCGKNILSMQDEYCYDCNRKKLHFEYGMALWDYEENLRKSIAEFKYHGRAEYGSYYAEQLAGHFGEEIRRIRPDILVPVPIHKSKLRMRGYNQAEIISKGLENILNIPSRNDILIREKKTLPQKGLNDLERKKNLQGAFAVKESFLKNKEPIQKVLLVDDIYTTGSTAEACTQVLLAAGIDKVYFISLCIGHGY